tara:strand:- start:3296 stop:5209 length:1914 start_codon:yes stop_codon:yes gene_type:complete
MADIFDLARSINAKKQQASQGYNSPLEDLPMQVMEIMNTRAKEKRVSLKNDSVLLSNLIKGASTGEELDNVRNLANKYSTDANKHDSTKLYGEAINQQFNSKQKTYNQYVASAEWLDSQMNNKTSEMNVADSVFKFENSDRAIRHNNKGAHIWTPNVEEKYGATKGDSFVGADGETYYTAKYDSKEKGDKASRSIINNMWEGADGDVDKFVRTYTGSDDEEVIANYKKEIESSKAKGGSYFKMTSQELQGLSLGDIEERIREFESISGGFEAGQALGFKYNKGKSSYVTLQNEYSDYKQRLDDTMKAHVTGDKISGEEAMGIMLGDFDNTKAQAIKQTNSNIAQQNKEYNALLALQRKNLTENDEDVWVGALGEETRGMSVDSVQDYINQKLPVALQGITNSKERLRMWTGLDTKAGKSDFYSSSNDDVGDRKKEKVLSPVRDMNQDGVIDSEEDGDKALPSSIQSPKEEVKPKVFGEDKTLAGGTLSGKELFPAGFFSGSSKKVSQQQNKQYPIEITLDDSKVSKSQNQTNKTKSLKGSTISRGDNQFIVVDTKIVNGKIKLKLSQKGFKGTAVGAEERWENPRYGEFILDDFKVESTNRGNSAMPIAFKKQGIPYYYDPIKDIYVVASNKVGKGK